MPLSVAGAESRSAELGYLCSVLAEAFAVIGAMADESKIDGAISGRLTCRHGLMQSRLRQTEPYHAVIECASSVRFCCAPAQVAAWMAAIGG